ncbi:hypothetical protein B1L11_03680 [Microbispora sp. GKU 823]|nr:hypothetical protein B1L11_03680 [Microbispora sp. GKU 823]
MGALPSVDLVGLPSLLGRLHAEQPAVTVRLRLAPAGSAGLTKALLDGELDVAFLSLPPRVPAGIEARVLKVVPIQLAVPADHRLAEREQVDLAETAEEAFIDCPPGYGNRDLIDREFAAAGLERHVVLEAPDVAMAAEFVGHGLGIAFLPAFAVPDHPGVRVLPVSGRPMAWPLHVATPLTRGSTAAARAFIGLLDQHLPSPDA